MDKICGSCTYLDLSDGNYYGKYYCNKKWDRHLATDTACDSYTKAYSRDRGTIENAIDFSKGKNNSGCYITTMLCDILKLSDSNYYLNTLRNFRDNYLAKDNQYKELLVEYDIVGPQICHYLLVDRQNKLIAAKMFFNYIKPVVSLINDKMYIDAINRYKMMIEALKCLYGIEANITEYEIASCDISKSGHGIYKQLCKKQFS